MCSIDWDMVLHFASPAATLVAATFALYVNAVVARRNKAIDIIVKCSERYDQIKDNNPINVENHADPISAKFLSKYWALQNDQFDYWLSGFIDPETMASWAFSCSIRLLSNFHQDGWLEYKKDYSAPNPIFSDFVEALRTISLGSPNGSHEGVYAAVMSELIAVERSERHFIRKIRGTLPWIFTSPTSMSAYKRAYEKKKSITRAG